MAGVRGAGEVRAAAAAGRVRGHREESLLAGSRHRLQGQVAEELLVLASMMIRLFERDQM